MDNSSVPSPDQPDNRQSTRVVVILLVALLALVGVSLHSQIASLFAPRVPPPPCGVSTLRVGGTKLRIQNLTPSSNSDLGIPSGKPGVAFWIQGTTGHYVFGLSPSSDNRALAQGLKSGDRIKIAWGDCSSDDYVVASTARVLPPPAELISQSQPGMSIIVPGSDGWLIDGQRPEALITPAPETPNPNAIQSKISFLDQSVSADRKTLTLKIAVKNTGPNVIHLVNGGITLTQGQGAPAAPQSVDPALPLDIQPGATQTITLTFAKPVGNVATFKLLDFSVDLYF